MGTKSKQTKKTAKTEQLAKLTALGAEDIEVGKAPHGFTGFEASCTVQGHGARAGGATKTDALHYLEHAVKTVKTAYGIVDTEVKEGEAVRVGTPPVLPSVGP